MTRQIPIFLEAGFRPFFLGAAVVAIANMLIWIGYLTGLLELYSEFSPSYWHLHEMMFGFIIAAVAGFLLTAVPNWTGRPPLKGFNLASLFTLWFIGRIAVFYSEITGAWFAAIADVPFMFILALYILNEVLAAGNKRNLPIVILLFSLGIANALMHAEYLFGIETAEYGYRLSIVVISTLIMVIGGRVIPNFTRNWLKNNGSTVMPTLINKLDVFCIIWSVFSLISWLFLPEVEMTGCLLIVAGIFNLIRLSRWQLKAIYRMPMLLIMQVSYLWLAIGFLTLGLANVYAIEYTNVALHALTIGAFAGMILAIMTRASLGHTGRKIIASRTTVAVYICINIAVVSRILAGVFDVMTTGLLHISATAWILAFGIFIFEYLPYFLRARK